MKYGYRNKWMTFIHARYQVFYSSRILFIFEGGLQCPYHCSKTLLYLYKFGQNKKTKELKEFPVSPLTSLLWRDCVPFFHLQTVGGVSTPPPLYYLICLLPTDNHQIISLFGLVWSVIYQKVDLPWTYFSAQTSFPGLPWSWDLYSFDWATI